ncbi:MAG: hypothetical protein EZS28_025190, partial [Streblomastix strix]
LAGHFIKTISQKINITYTDFIDSTFTGSGNSIMIDEQQASEISFIWCNFTNLRIDDDGQISSCIHSILSSENGFLFNVEYCIFSDCRYNGLSQVLGNVITIQSQQSDKSAIRQVKFLECIITNNKGNGQSGAVMIDLLTKCTINVVDSYFNENSGTEANDIWIRSTNNPTELNIINFNTSYSDSVQSHIVTINEDQEQTFDLNNFPGVIFVSNKTMSGIRDGSRDNPYQKILNSIIELNYTSKSVHMPRTIYILDDIWDESLLSLSLIYPLTIKSGLIDDENGNRISGSIRPFNEHIYMDPIDQSSSLTIISCIFNGLGVDGDLVNHLIAAYYLKRMVLIDSIFQNANVGIAAIFFNQSQADATFIAQNCKFLNLKSIQYTTWGILQTCSDNANYTVQVTGQQESTTFSSHIDFIGVGTVKQEGLALLLIEQCSFNLIDKVITHIPLISAIRGLLEINNCQFGSINESKLGSSVISCSAQCINIIIFDSIFSNLNSNLTNENVKASGIIVIELGSKTSVELSQCIFLQCIDSSSNSSISSGSICFYFQPQVQKYSNEQEFDNNFGRASVINCQFTQCQGKYTGGIYFGDNVIPISAQNNIFTLNSFTSQTDQSASDIFFASKELLDQSGGILFVASGYQYKQVSGSTQIGEVKIKDVTTNFAEYLNCITTKGTNCGDIPCGGNKGTIPETCLIKDSTEDSSELADPDKVDDDSFPIGAIIGIILGVL